ncbi:MAG TPA: efflux RND transporter periplasmic adaptor subunit [Flavisolibacter sp.]|nr:efflux RND transporter periplasmic adaptor subunit [Flavisolibacter sp.]
MNRLLCPGLFALALSCGTKKETTKPVVQDITESVYASGKIKSNGQYEVYTAVNGILARKYVKEGDHVKRGDTLFSLVNELPQLNRDNALLSVQYQSIQANRDKLSEAEADLERARLKLQNDSALLERQNNLWEAGIGSRNELEQRQLSANTSLQAFRMARSRYYQLQKQLQYAERQSHKNLQITNAVSGDYMIRAQKDGRVFSITKEVGEAVSPQIPIAVLGDTSDFYLELQVDEFDITKIKPLQRVCITMDSYKGHIFEAYVTKIDPYLNTASRSVTIEARFRQMPPVLLPNLTAEANILIRISKNALLIPRAFLIGEDEVQLQNGVKKKISVGIKDYQWAEVLRGLNPEEKLQRAE